MANDCSKPYVVSCDPRCRSAEIPENIQLRKTVSGSGAEKLNKSESRLLQTHGIKQSLQSDSPKMISFFLNCHSCPVSGYFIQVGVILAGFRPMDSDRFVNPQIHQAYSETIAYEIL